MLPCFEGVVVLFFEFDYWVVLFESRIMKRKFVDYLIFVELCLFVGIFIGLKPSESENYSAQRCILIQIFLFEEENVNSRLLNTIEL